MNGKTLTWVTAGVVATGLLTVQAADVAPRKGLGHGECSRESCDGQGRQEVRERQYRNRGGDGNGSETREYKRRGAGRGEGRGEGSGQGQFRRGEGSADKGWHRDGTGARK